MDEPARIRQLCVARSDKPYLPGSHITLSQGSAESSAQFEQNSTVSSSSDCAGSGVCGGVSLEVEVTPAGSQSGLAYCVVIHLSGKTHTPGVDRERPGTSGVELI